MAKNKGNKVPKSKYFKKQARKKVVKRIKKFSADGNISKRDSKRIAKASAGYLKTGQLKRMIGRNGDLQIHNKLKKQLRKFNIPAMQIPIPGYDMNKKLGGGDPNPPRIPQVGLDPYVDPTVPAGLEEPTLREKLDGIEDTYTEDMALADDPRNRRYVLGIRTKRGDRNRQGARGAFGRKGKRIKGLQNTSINL